MLVDHRPKIVLLPGWWYDVLGGLGGLLCLGLLLATGATFPEIAPVVLFGGLLVAAENSEVLLPSGESVSPAFMIVMAAIAAFGHRGAVLGVLTSLLTVILAGGSAFTGR